MLQKERARVENILIRGLSDEEKDKMYKMLVRESREEAIMESVDKLVASGEMDADKACEILGVSVDAYEAYRSQK